MTLHQLQTLYRQLFETLQTLKESVDSGEQSTLESLEQECQAIVQQSDMERLLEGLPVAIAPRLQSLHTETRKQLRLLNTDLIFLKTARQTATQQQRRSQLHTRIQQLMDYCQVVLQLPPIEES